MTEKSSSGIHITIVYYPSVSCVRDRPVPHIHRGGSPTSRKLSDLAYPSARLAIFNSRPGCRLSCMKVHSLSFAPVPVSAQDVQGILISRDRIHAGRLRRIRIGNDVSSGPKPQHTEQAICPCTRMVPHRSDGDGWLRHLDAR